MVLKAQKTGLESTAAPTRRFIENRIAQRELHVRFLRLFHVGDRDFTSSDYNGIATLLALFLWGGKNNPDFQDSFSPKRTFHAFYGPLIRSKSRNTTRDVR